MPYSGFDEGLNGAVLTLAVAQRPFEHPNESGIPNVFATLAPLLYEDGRRADPKDFPTMGDVWWMVRGAVRGLAEPGRLVTGSLERSGTSGKVGKADYQVRVDSVEAAKPSQVVEVVGVPDDWAADPRGLVARDDPLPLDHPPMDVVHVAWRGHLYGPLRTSCVPDPAGLGRWLVRFSPPRPDNVVLRFSADDFRRALPPGRDHAVALAVSLTEHPPYRSYRQHDCHYRLIPAEDFRRAAPGDPDRLVLEGDQALLGRVVKSLGLSRSKRQQLQQLLAEVADRLNGEAPPEGAGVLTSLRRRLEGDARAADQLADVLVRDPSMAAPLEEARRRAEREYLEQHAARLQSQVEEQVAAGRKELADLRKRRDALAEEAERLRRDSEAGLEKELAARREEFERGLQARERELEKQREELDRRRKELTGHLTALSEELSGRREQLVTQFLALAPLFRQAGLLPEPAAPAVPAAAPAAPAATPAGPSRAPLVLPAFVTGGTAPARAVTEPEFFERFCRHVEASGFRHRRVDLAAFHLSVKCNDLTVLGGLPGTGKSSLPRLYAEALAGDDGAEGMRRFLHVGVSPAWLDPRDLLGHPNALDRCYQPGESGLYQHLVYAQEEEARRGPAGRPYLVVLDEMNLAQVEHYFGAFLQALERPPGSREVRCFAPEVVAPDDPFAPWPVLRLPRALRFVGTVNFDETTRPLSQRVLDRADLVRLRPPFPLESHDPATVRCPGPPVTAGAYREWVRPAAPLGRAAAEVLDQLHEPLARLGCPLNPRRYNALRRFVGNAPEAVCAPEQALDLQIAQRLLPQARGLFRPGARQALDEVRRVLAAHPPGFPESLLLLDEIRAGAEPSDLFGEESGT